MLVTVESLQSAGCTVAQLPRSSRLNRCSLQLGCTVQRRHVRNVDIMHVTVQFVKVLQYIYVLCTKIRLGNARVTNVVNTKLTKYTFILNKGDSCNL